MKVSIIGLAGSGKTALARELSARFSAPHIQLDRLWFEAGGRLNQTEEKKAEVAEKMRREFLPLLEGDAWVSDGFYTRHQPEIASKADVLLFLDLPLPVRLWNHAKRMFHPTESHKELTFLDDLVFFYEIVRRTYLTRPSILKLVADYPSKVTRLRSRKEISAYLSTIVDLR